MRRVVAILALVFGARCASSPSSPAGTQSPESITPADLVSSIADIAAGRNAAMAEAGLVLKRIEFKLSVGSETKGGGKIAILLLDAEASRATETAFLQQFTLEIPATGGRGVTAKPFVPGVREFIDAAMNTARDLARVTSESGLPQRIQSVELVAKITRSKKAGGGIAVTIPVAIKPSIGIDAGVTREEENTVRLVFEAVR
ncbi:MAG TPA: hypothetical protein VGL03_09470 [Thermoanaerobaculia bacterium]|jgi:hypothetical protein